MDVRGGVDRSFTSLHEVRHDGDVKLDTSVVSWDHTVIIRNNPRLIKDKCIGLGSPTPSCSQAEVTVVGLAQLGYSYATRRVKHHWQLHPHANT
eukprot:scaffold252965_cov37-Prasinocladus_malaysianus.AAC.3